MEERILLIYLHKINGVGDKTLRKLLVNLDSLNQLFTLKPLELSMQTGISFTIAEKIINMLTEANIKDFYRELKSWQDKGIFIWTLLDKDYPTLLKEISHPPIIMYGLGNKEIIHQPAIAIVGTRNPTSYGKIVAEKISENLSEYGWIIVSGMARGIDRVAHEGTFAHFGRTIAVLGSGIDVIYPSEHRALYSKLKEKGLIISEYPPGTSAHPGYFPARNRIISGLSYGTIVVEASLKSGSLITAQFAVEQSREVFAVPGTITSKQSIGTNSLIKQGAKLIQNIEDIIEEFPYLKIGQKKEKEDNLNKIEGKILNIITHEQIHIDDIYDKSQLNLSEVYDCLLSLQLKGRIKQLSGGYYIRNEL